MGEKGKRIETSVYIISSANILLDPFSDQPWQKRTADVNFGTICRGIGG